MKTAYEDFARFLGSRGLKNTPQRKTILHAFFTAKKHLSSEELYSQLRKIDKGIGQATVYRTLKLLCDAGLAKELNFGDGSARYEVAFGRTHHDHLICTSCDKNIEFLNPTIERLQEELAEQHGFVLTSHRLYLYGTCPDCQKQQNPQAKKENA